MGLRGELLVEKLSSSASSDRFRDRLVLSSESIMLGN